LYLINNQSQVDKIWEAFWTGGIFNPLSVSELKLKALVNQ
jgi:hypothetical protein